MATRKIIGIVFSIIGIIFSIVFIIQSDLNIDLKEYFDFTFKSYFSLSYFNQILPLTICLILTYGGILLLIMPTKSNPILALFGITVIENFLFNWLGLITIDFPIFVVTIFLCTALLALWIAYSDTINQKRLSLKNGISSLIIGTFINAFSYFF